MKRHEALVPLSHDHHHGLVQARRLREAAREPGNGARLAAARAFLDFFSRETVPHFAKEEDGAFALLARYAGEEPALVEARKDHVELQALAARLDGEVEAGVASAVLMLAIGAKLEAHIRLEERELFPLLERVAPPTLLRLVAEQAF
jgi:hemerythrin-like domain-containing protein